MAGKHLKDFNMIWKMQVSYWANTEFSPRLEVQADVQKERCSLSGESGTVSLGTVSDNASTKAMAGSIINSYVPLDR